MKIDNIPKPGLRNAKTSLAVFLCVLLFELIKRPNPLIACSATIICMRETVFYSYMSGIDRLIGTLIGGIVGLVFLLIKSSFVFLPTLSISVGLGISIVIYLCTFFEKSDSTIISCVVFLAIVLGTNHVTPFSYAINRMIDTFIGIIIALGVNSAIYPIKEEDSI